jgi:UPF0755 protein
LARILTVGLAAALLAAIFAGVAVWHGWHWFQSGQSWFSEPAPKTGDERFEIAPGTGIAQISRQLADRGYLAHPRVWRAAARYLELDGQLQAGTYALDPDAVPAALLQQFVQGEVISYTLSIIEGTKTSEVLAQLRQAPGLKATLGPVDTATVMHQLGLGEGSGEGRFFPDTYRYRDGDTDAALLRQAYDRMQANLDDVWRSRAEDLPLKDPGELLTMASIIEKETGRPEDRGQISQVFSLRLRKGMRLQTDPTVIYGLGDAFDGNLRRRDLRRDTPYNSYTRDGLPPTPIALPGRAALEAAANPAAGDFLYFVSRGDGSSEFSRTLAEHNAAVRRFQLGQP